MILMIIFSLIQAAENIIQRNQRSITIYSLKDESAIGFVAGKNSYIIMNDSDETMSVQLERRAASHWLKLGITQHQLLKSTDNVDNLHKKNNVIDFFGYRIYTVDSTLAVRLRKSKEQKQLTTDLLIIKGNAFISKDKIDRLFTYRKIIIDDNAKKSFYRKWTKDKRGNSTLFHSLKEKGAFHHDMFTFLKPH